MKDIKIRFIAQSEQRYDTVGDWETCFTDMNIVRTTSLPSDDHSFLIAIHELVEMYLCQKDGVTQEMVDKWDMRYDDTRNAQVEPKEPGGHPLCPYKWQHQRAETVERVLAEILGVDWGFYQREVERALEGGK